MNLVGKIFTVLIFLMCIVFATFALMVHAAHKNWMAVVVQQKKDLDEANKKQKELNDEKVSLEKSLADEKERKKAQLIALAQEVKIRTDEMIAQRDVIKLKEEELAKDVATIGDIQKRNNVLQTTIDRMRVDIKVAVDDKNATFKKLVDTNDNLLNAVADRDKLQKLNRELVDQSEKMKSVLAFNKIPPGPPKGMPEGLKGEVTSASNQKAIEISIGEDDGVRKGQQYLVWRPSTGKYVAVIEVTSVDYPNRAVCRPVKGSPNDLIQRGDYVQANTIKAR